MLSRAHVGLDATRTVGLEDETWLNVATASDKFSVCVAFGAAAMK